MAKPKTIMDMTPQELLKMFVASVGELIKAAHETQKTLLMAEIKASEARLNEHIATEIKASEKRTKDELRGEIKATEERLTKHILVLDARVLHRIEKVTKRLDNHRERIENIENRLELPHQ